MDDRIPWNKNWQLLCDIAAKGYSQKGRVEVRRPFPQTLTPFITKVSDFCHPIYDLAKNLIPYYDLCSWYSYPKHHVGLLVAVLLIIMKVASFKKHTQYFQTWVLKPYPIFFLFSNLSNWKEEAWKISGHQRDSTLWPPRHRCDARPTELWSHKLGARSICWVHIFPHAVKWWEI